MTAITRTADQVSSESTNACAGDHAAEATAHETTGNAAADGTNGRASAGGGPIAAGGERETREQNGKQ